MSEEYQKTCRDFFGIISHVCVCVGDEVRQMLEGLCTVLKGDVSSDLIHGAHTAALMLQQIFKQADKWHLKLQVDLAQLESRYRSLQGGEGLIACV